jgi:surface polysaccharide O-acyltransferase-like enzyme
MESINPPVQRKKRTYYLDVARAFAIISISTNHALNRTYQMYSGQSVEFENISRLASWIEALIAVYSRLGVPLFLMITGALVLRKSMETREDVQRFYKHNLLSMLITAEIWYVIMYWFMVLVQPTNTVLENKGFLGAVSGMFQTMLFQNQLTLGSMWYMPMILCVYTTIPMAILLKDQVRSKPLMLLIPATVLFMNNMVRPAVNSLRSFWGLETFETALNAANLFSVYYLYIIAGYLISRGALKKWKDRSIVAGVLGCYAFCCIYQYYAFSQPDDYIVSYDFPVILICAAFLFELIRRKARLLKAFRRPIIYLSKISFGIYFVHVLFNFTMFWYLDLSALGHVQKVLLLEVVPVGASILVITLLSRVPKLKQYLFMIKD